MWVVLDPHGIRIERDQPSSEAWNSFQCGVYQIGPSSLAIVGESLSTTQLEQLRRAVRPDGISVAAMTLLSELASCLRIQIEIVEPIETDRAAVAIASIHASYHDAFVDEPIEGPIEALVRILGDVYRVRLSRDELTQMRPGTVTLGDANDRREMSGWAIYRSVASRDGFGVWDATGFRIVDNMRAAERAVGFAVWAIAGRDVAVISEPLSSTDRELLAATERPPSVASLVVAKLLSSPADPIARLEAEQIGASDVDRTAIAVVAACASYGEGIFTVAVEQYLVRVGDEVFTLSLEFDDETRTWSARTKPAP